jgi:hypothetical protein
MTDDGFSFSFADFPDTGASGEDNASASSTPFADGAFTFTFADFSDPPAPQGFPDPSQNAGTPDSADTPSPPDTFVFPSDLGATDSARARSAPNSTGDGTAPVYLTDAGRASSHDFVFPAEFSKHAAGSQLPTVADPTPQELAPDKPFAAFDAPKKKEEPAPDFTDPFATRPKAYQAPGDPFAIFTAASKNGEASPNFADPFAGFEAPKKKEEPQPQLGGGFTDPAAVKPSASDQPAAPTDDLFASFSAPPKKEAPAPDFSDPFAAKPESSDDPVTGFEQPTPEFTDPSAANPQTDQPSDDPVAAFSAPATKERASPEFSEPSAANPDAPSDDLPAAKKEEEAAPGFDIPFPAKPPADDSAPAGRNEAAPSEDLFAAFSAGQDEAGDGGFSFSPGFGDDSASGNADGFSFNFGGDGGFAFNFGEEGQTAGDGGFAFPVQGEGGDSGLVFTFSASELPPEEPEEPPSPEDDQGPSDEAYEAFRELIMNSVFDQPKTDVARMFDKPDPTDNLQAALASLLKK